MLTIEETTTIRKLFSKMEGSDFNTVVALFKEAQNNHQRKATVGLHRGQYVQWIHRGMRMEGTIDKINTKTVKITTKAGAKWSVAPSLLSKA